MEKSEVLDLLNREIIDIEFVKTNGETRLMTCTLQANSLPAKDQVTESARQKNPDVCAVFDTISQGWRSFRWDSLLSVNGAQYND